MSHDRGTLNCTDDTGLIYSPYFSSTATPRGSLMANPVGKQFWGFGVASEASFATVHVHIRIERRCLSSCWQPYRLETASPAWAECLGSLLLLSPYPQGIYYDHVCTFSSYHLALLFSLYLFPNLRGVRVER